MRGGRQAAAGHARAWEVSNERTFGHEPQWEGSYLYYASTEAGAAERQFYRIRPDGSAKERLSGAEGVHTGVVSRGWPRSLCSPPTLTQPMDLLCGRRARHHLDAGRIRASTRGPEIRFCRLSLARRRQDRRGQDDPASRLRPKDKSRRWPAVFFIHGSGYATSILKQWGAYQQERFVFNSYLANRGYVVFDLDYRGSSGYGRDWRTGVYLHMGGKDLDDVLGAVDYARGLGNIDMRRARHLGIELWRLHDQHGDVPFARHLPRGRRFLRRERLGKLQRLLHRAAPRQAAGVSGSLPAQLSHHISRAGSRILC